VGRSFLLRCENLSCRTSGSMGKLLNADNCAHDIIQEAPL